MITVVGVSDTHSKIAIDTHKVPDCDILIHAGDATTFGNSDEIKKWIKWMQAQPATNRCYCPGNHDLSLDPAKKEAANGNAARKRKMIEDAGIIVLIDQEVT